MVGIASELNATLFGMSDIGSTRLFAFHPIYVQNHELHKKGGDFMGLLCKAPRRAERGSLPRSQAKPDSALLEHLLD